MRPHSFAACGVAAEEEGVEPSRPFGSAVFETAAIASWLALPRSAEHLRGPQDLRPEGTNENSQASDDAWLSMSSGKTSGADAMAARGATTVPRGEAS